MSISFNKLLDVMQKENKNKYYLRQNGINPNMLNKLLATGDTGTKTIDKLCKLLNCQPGDIMEYVPDDKAASDGSNN